MILALLGAIPFSGYLVAIAGALGLVAVGNIIFKWASFTLGNIALFDAAFYILMKILLHYIDVGIKARDENTFLVLTVIAVFFLLLSSNNLGIVKLGVFSASITP